MPVRIQMKRSRGFRLQEESKKINGLSCVLVSRPSKWGNPYMSGDAQFDVYQFREMAIRKWRNPVIYEKWIAPLRGKNLACWCKIWHDDGTRVPCHADILLELANKE